MGQIYMLRKSLPVVLPFISRLAGFAQVGGTLANIGMMHRFSAGITSIIAFTVLSSLMAGMLLVCGFYGMYLGLVQYGMDSNAALMVIALVMLFLTILLGAMAYLRLQELRDIPTRFMRREPPGFARVGNVVNAFLKGFNEGPHSI